MGRGTGSPRAPPAVRGLGDMAALQLRGAGEPLAVQEGSLAPWPLVLSTHGMAAGMLLSTLVTAPQPQLPNQAAPELGRLLALPPPKLSLSSG